MDRPHPVVIGSALFAYACLAFLLSALADDLADLPHKACVSLRVTNCYARTVRVANGPANLCAEVRVQPREEHRGLEVVWDYAPRISITDDENGSPDDPFREIESQDGSLGSSMRSLNGAEERLRHDVKMSELSGGTYLVKARVFTDTEHKTVCGFAQATVQVR